MLRRFSTIFTLSCLLVAFMAMTVFAAKSPVEQKRSVDQRISKSLYYSYPDESIRQDAVGSVSLGKSTYSRSASAVSPGKVVGNTWYDYQHNGSIGRMIEVGNDANAGTPGAAVVHFGWMKLPGAALAERNYAYNHYNADLGTVGILSDIQLPDEYAGYVNVQSTNDGRAVVGGHNDQGSGNQTHIYYDFSPGFAFWNLNSRIPDATASYGASATQAVIWPKFAYQEGTDTVTHVIAQVSAPSAADPQSIYYFRKVGINATGTWDFPPRIVDTIYDLSHDIVASKISDKVVLAWTANLAYDPAFNDGTMSACDTCSDTSPFSVQWDNDIYMQTSDDQGLTWNPRVNATKYQYGVDGYRAYTDLSVTLDATDNGHVVWSAVPWKADIANTFLDSQCRLFHYSENVPFIRTVANAEWATSLANGTNTFDCGPGAWNIFISKMQVSECDGKMYVMWVQFQDLPNGITDDCARRASSEYSGSANGDLYIALSSDGGVTWDAPRNLTNSRTPGCDPDGGFGDCESDNWASMSRYGRANIAGEDWSNAVIVDPSGSYAGNNYLDISYVHDRDAGGIVQNEGTWQLSNMNWFRLACVEPVPNPQISFTPNNIAAPVWTKPGIELPLDLTIENNGNVGLTYSTSIVIDNGPAGWLAVSGLSGAVPSGLSNVEVGTLHLNNGGVQATEAGLSGRVVFTSNAPSTPDTLSVYLLVVDTLTPAEVDTVIGYLSLAVKNTGNYGNSGDNRINLDFVTNGADCDTTATVYLYDGSPVVLQVNGVDTLLNGSIFNDSWLSPNGFRPTGGKTSGAEATYNWYSTGTFVTPDSTIAFEETYFAPTTSGANYMVKKLKVWSHDGLAHNGLRIGDAIDWDIPSDSGARNTSAFDATRNLIYQVGGEFDQDDTLANGTVNPQGSDCIDADTRYGGMAFMKSVLNGTDDATIPYSAFTARNDSFVFPNGNFVSGQLWNNMDLSGYTVETATQDQHMVMCYTPGLNLGATDVVEYWTILATVENGTASDIETAVDNAMTFACSDIPEYVCGCCFVARGNVDGGPDNGTFPGSVDIGDLVYLVAFMFQGGATPPCIDEANIDASTGTPLIDISDLVALVAFMFQGGAAPAACN